MKTLKQIIDEERKTDKFIDWWYVPDSDVPWIWVIAVVALPFIFAGILLSK